MTNKLGEAWWAESKRTNRNYMATQHVLKLATRHAISDGLQRPKLARIPAVKIEYLNYLKINKTDLHSRELNKIIKDAYRKQVKIHHPDLGGHAATFRKIHNPICIHRRGFPDKWYYNEESRKWVQPTSLHE